MLASYPLDYMKTMLQTDCLREPTYNNLRHCFQENIRDGVGTFYKGLLITVNRGFFVNAGGFFAFELTMRTLGRSGDSE